MFSDLNIFHAKKEDNFIALFFRYFYNLLIEFPNYSFNKKIWIFEFLRPNFRIQDNYGRIFLRREDKRKKPNITPKVLSELFQKCFEPNKYQYNGIYLVFGMIVVGSEAEIHIIDLKPICSSSLYFNNITTILKNYIIKQNYIFRSL